MLGNTWSTISGTDTPDDKGCSKVDVSEECMAGVGAGNTTVGSVIGNGVSTVGVPDSLESVLLEVCVLLLHARKERVAIKTRNEER